MPRFKRYRYDRMAQRAIEAFDQDSPTVIAVDTETSGFEWDDEAFCVTFTWRSPKNKFRSFYIDLADDPKRSRIVRYILSDTLTWVFHNAKFDLQKLELADALPDTWSQIEDTQILHALLDENDRHGLKYLAHKILGESTNEEKVLAKVRRKLKIKKDEGYHLLPREVVVPYAMKDTEFTLRLWEVLYPMLADQGYDLYHRELETSFALGCIEAEGIGLDLDFLRKTHSEYGVKLMKLEAKLQELARDPENPDKVFNPNSPKQILEAFARRGITAEATDKATLADLTDELAITLLEYRHIKKMHATYLTGMMNEQIDGVLHPNFNLTLPRTGRMSSSAASNN